MQRSRQFHRPRYVALVVDLLVSVAVLAALTRLRLPLGFWAGAVAYPVVVRAVMDATRLPTAWWRHRHDVRWNLSQQPALGWAVDEAKGLAVGAALAVVAFVPLFALVRYVPHDWPWLAALGAGALVCALGVLAPIVLEPVFNRFTPLDDGELATRLHELAERACAPVREILVADASRRTSRQNAYVSGLGRTRRVVLWDTLLATPADEIAVVLAHELGHRVHRHVAALTVAGVVGVAGFVAALRLVLARPAPHDTAAIVLLGLGLELAAAPAAAWLSRRFERVADRFSVVVTGDRAAFVSLHRRLALANLADLQPPKWLYAWLASHPTPPERISDT